MSDTTPSSFRHDLLAGQVAFVTGGATGIGKEICRVLGRHGARIAMLSRKEARLKAAVEELQGEGIEAHHEVGDVREPDAVAAAVRGILARFGRIDILVNNAAGNFPAPMTQISPNGFRSVVAIDLLGTYNVSRAVFDAWQREHGGNIVNISAPFELKGVALQAHVAAAKAGVDSLTRSCAVEWGPYGIRVNAVAPGSHREHRGRCSAFRSRWPIPVRAARSASRATAATSPMRRCSSARRLRVSSRDRSSRWTAPPPWTS